MPLITGQTLIEAGWIPGPKFPALLAAAADYESRGIHDVSYLLKLLKRDFDKDVPRLRLRDEPVAFTEAIAATCDLDEANLAGVRRFMDQLLRVPVIESGAVMPDACPAGAATATIPVGGAIAVKNAILPAAHSADICCSMHASLFRCGESTARMLDDLVASTRFGFGGRKEEDRVAHRVLDETVWSNPFLRGLEEHAAKHMADQGDGNHFAYLGKIRVTRGFVRALDEAGYEEIARAIRDASGDRLDDPDGDTFYSLVTHHGSRGLGAQVFARGHKAAMRETGKIADGIPDAAAWLDATTPEGQDYW
jgi:hypothetical protein